ncbi:hypothetical protein GURASL_34800 [Geotalea uraniireducens]|uniref:Uncharacterized protein n=1 Tax=Geotalea uraniireducens TaxID=351604 RepID=A0ABN6VYG9_9BACT|nr:hypothetical protein GURASL_34800 [Geotalea uraniireducens]
MEMAVRQYIRRRFWEEGTNPQDGGGQAAGDDGVAMVGKAGHRPVGIAGGNRSSTKNLAHAAATTKRFFEQNSSDH